MSLETLSVTSRAVAFSPRTLRIDLSNNLVESLSKEARKFIEQITRGQPITAATVTDDTWCSDDSLRDLFDVLDAETRTEILAFISIFVHEYSHRVDFLTSPFGLQYYATNLIEYLAAQTFFPRILDDPVAVDQLRFLAGNVENDEFKKAVDPTVAEAWLPLEKMVRLFYAYGDVSKVAVIGKFVEDGWGTVETSPLDLFGVGLMMDPVMVFNVFATVKPVDSPGFWYLRPLTVFETKGVVNSLSFILHLVGDEDGVQECLRYYEGVYVKHRNQMPADYSFMLDVGARIFGVADFKALLEANDADLLKAVLACLSSGCWYALHAPPPKPNENPVVANPVLRLADAVKFQARVMRDEIQTDGMGWIAAFGLLDAKYLGTNHYRTDVGEILQDCRTLISDLTRLNQENTWNPDMRAHFDHIFGLMRAAFDQRSDSYVSRIGVPDVGNPLFSIETRGDVDLFADDYLTPEAVTDWYGIRSDLFFKLNKPSSETLDKLNQHFQAPLLNYTCEHCSALNGEYVSRFAQRHSVRCGRCGREEQLEDSTIVPVPRESR